MYLGVMLKNVCVVPVVVWSARSAGGVRGRLGVLAGREDVVVEVVEAVRLAVDDEARPVTLATPVLHPPAAAALTATAARPAEGAGGGAWRTSVTEARLKVEHN